MLSDILRIWRTVAFFFNLVYLSTKRCYCRNTALRAVTLVQNVINLHIILGSDLTKVIHNINHIQNLFMFSLLIFVVHHLVYILVNLTNELVKFIRLLHSFFLLKKKDSLRHSSLNYYYDLFYIYDNNGKRRKIVPTNIAELLTPCALAYWIMERFARQY